MLVNDGFQADYVSLLVLLLFFIDIQLDTLTTSQGYYVVCTSV